MENGTTTLASELERITDEELFMSYVDGNAIAMEALLGRISRPLLGTITRRVGDRNLAEDIFQDTLERVVRNRDSYDSDKPLRAWIWSIAINRCTDHFRKNREVTIDNPDAERGNISDPESVAMGRQRLARMLDALESLPGDQREVFLMREEAGLSFKVISESTGRPLGTVLSQMRLALKKLAEALENAK